MIRPLLAALPGAVDLRPQHESLAVSTETPIGGIIPDVLLGAWKRWPEPVKAASLTSRDLAVLALLEREQRLTRHAVAMRLFLSPAGLDASLATLTDAGLVISTGPWFSARQRIWGSYGEVLAFEAKMRRWREAVTQAAQYRTFADRSFVVLDGNQVAAGPALVRACKAEGVGLILLHGRIARLILSAPRRKPVPSLERALALYKLAGVPAQRVR